MSLIRKNFFSFIAGITALGLLACFLSVPYAQADSGLWGKMIGKEGMQAAFNYGEGVQASPQAYIANLIKIFLSFLGLIFLLLIIWGGFRWMTSGGNEERLKQAKGYVKNSIIGFVIIVLSYMIVTFVVKLVEETLWWSGA